MPRLRLRRWRWLVGGGDMDIVKRVRKGVAERINAGVQEIGGGGAGYLKRWRSAMRGYLKRSYVSTYEVL